MKDNESINVDLLIEQSNNEAMRKDNRNPIDWKLIIVIFLCGILFSAIKGVIGGIYDYLRDDVEVVTDTIVVERWDTVFIDKPTEVIRYVMRHDTIRDSSITFIVDTISASPTAIIPIERTIYRDSVKNAKYEAYLSGFHASLDSINIECLSKESVITITEREKASRWGVGIQAGVGISAQGVAAPYVGVGVQYRLFGK